MNFISRIIKSINAMRERLKIERHEAGQNRRKLVDVFISCNGESKKLSVPAERSIINDTSA